MCLFIYLHLKNIIYSDDIWIFEQPQNPVKHANHTVDGRNPANQLRLVVYPVIYTEFYIPGGDRRIPEPSTVVIDLLPTSSNCNEFPHTSPSLAPTSGGKKHKTLNRFLEDLPKTPLIFGGWLVIRG